MKIQATKFKEWDYYFHEQRKGKKRKLLVALKSCKQ